MNRPIPLPSASTDWHALVSDDDSAPLIAALAQLDLDCAARPALTVALRARLNHHYPYSRSPLYTAIDSSLVPGPTAPGLDVLTLLLDAGADPNIRSFRGVTPLIYVAHSAGSAPLGAARALLAAGADPNLIDDYGLTALSHALSGLPREPVGFSFYTARQALGLLLLDGGADPNVRNSAGRTPLFSAVLEWLPDPVLWRAVLARADLNLRDEQGCTVLHHAAAALNAETVSLLLEAGADPNAKNAAGHTPLTLALSPGRARRLCHTPSWAAPEARRVVAALLDHGADPRTTARALGPNAARLQVLDEAAANHKSAFEALAVHHRRFQLCAARLVAARRAKAWSPTPVSS